MQHNQANANGLLIVMETKAGFFKSYENNTKISIENNELLIRGKSDSVKVNFSIQQLEGLKLLIDNELKSK